jgi:nicotinate dehydrogenase subunit B
MKNETGNNNSPELKNERETETSRLNRRDFLKLMGGGIIVTFLVDDFSKAQSHRPVGREYPEDFNAYLRINENGRVSCFSGKIEQGQGIITSLGLMLADELDVPMESVDVILGDTDICPWDMGTFGSRTTKYFGPALREAAAEAREVLLQLAAEHLDAPRQTLTVKDGVVFVKSNPLKKVSYAELTKGKAILKHLDKKPLIKHYSKHIISGKSYNRTDGFDKVTGRAKYAGDIRLPGMLYARILRPPVHGAVLKSVDTSPAEKIEGIKIVRDNDLIAVLHEHPQEAERALKLVRADYEIPEAKVDNDTIFDHLLKVDAEESVTSEQGDPGEGERISSKKFDVSYFNHYVAHAPMEPHTAVVKIEGNKATAWASSQTPFRVREDVAGALGIPSDNVHVISPFVGGGFGGKTRNQQAIEAARLAKLAGKPVQVAWTREEEFFYDTFRPAAVINIKSGISDKGEIEFWEYLNYFAGDRSSKPFYDIPHFRVKSRGGWQGRESVHPFGVGAWRGPGSNTNVFAMESHIDVMAEQAEMDPLTFRFKNLRDERMKRLLRAVADKFNHSFSVGSSGKGVGIACTDYLGTYVATMAEVAVNEQTGSIRVKRIVCAQDCGEIINPEGTRMQIEGGLIMGLGYVLTEEIRFRGGEILDRNFDTYELPRFSWLPAIEVVLLDNPEIAPQGVGEPAITTMGGVIANAVYDAVGVRLFTLPMTPKRIIEALKKRK